MVTNIRTLRYSTKEILSAVERGETVWITNRWKTCAKIVPAKEIKNLKNRKDMKNPSKFIKKTHQEQEGIKKHPAFGMLKDDLETADVPAYIRKIRKGRYAV